MGRGGVPSPHTLITWSRGRSHRTTIYIYLQYPSFQPSTIQGSEENLSYVLKFYVMNSHDLQTGSTPMMGRGIHPLYHRDPPWLGTLKLISTWPGLWRLGWVPPPPLQSTAWVQGEIISAYIIYPLLECHATRIPNWWIGTHMSSTSGWFPATGRGIHPLVAGCPPEVEYILNGFFSRPVLGAGGVPTPQVLMTGSGRGPHFKQHPWSCQGPDGMTKELIWRSYSSFYERWILWCVIIAPPESIQS